MRKSCFYEKNARRRRTRKKIGPKEENSKFLYFFGQPLFSSSTFQDRSAIFLFSYFPPHFLERSLFSSLKVEKYNVDAAIDALANNFTDALANKLDVSITNRLSI